MAAITPESYQNIVDLYTAALQQVEGVEDNYLDAAQIVLELNDFGPEIDLLKAFYQAYLNSVYLSRIPPFMIEAVAALQRHVIANA